MHLPFSPPFLPMLAKRVDRLPDGDHWMFEPKWDGFRALVFRDGSEILLQSRDKRPLDRYFPELVQALPTALPKRCITEPDKERPRMPGGQSRWSQGRDLSWEPLRPELVSEVEYDHMQGARFRHVAHLRRWRHDKAAKDCTFDQLDVIPPHEIAAIFHPA